MDRSSVYAELARDLGKVSASLRFLANTASPKEMTAILNATEALSVAIRASSQAAAVNTANLQMAYMGYNYRSLADMLAYEAATFGTPYQPDYDLLDENLPGEGACVEHDRYGTFRHFYELGTHTKDRRVVTPVGG